MCELGKGKAVPLQAWTGPKGSRKLRSPNFVTTAQDGGKAECANWILYVGGLSADGIQLP